MSNGLTGRRAPTDGIAVEVRTVRDLGELLRRLRRRQAHRRGEAEITYRELAARTGWSLGTVAGYLGGKVLPPTDRFDTLVRLLDATPAEQGALATVRDRVAERRRAPVPGRPDVPRQLPATAAHFTGRAAHLAALSELARGDEPTAAAPSMVIAAIAGAAGVGKTTLAVHWAHENADRFPDGQLYVDLRGFDSGEPLRPSDVLAMFLRGLGVDAAAMPVDEGERAALYRTALAGRKVLVVLDNAATAAQVRPLLPGSSSCLVIVTSRNDLAGLVAQDGARRIDLDVLTTQESVDLLRALIGRRVAAEPAAATELATLCGCLPLALRPAAELAAAQPATPLADLVAELRDDQRRLDLLDAGGDPQAVRGVFSWSLRHLSPAAVSAFALIGLHPGRGFDQSAVAAMTGTDGRGARRVIDELVRAHLLTMDADGRLGLHDLMRVYAAERAATDVAPDLARLAVTRLLDHYRSAAVAAARALFPYEQDLPDVPPPAGPPLDRLEDAQRWLDAERANLVALAGYAAAHGWPRHGVHLSLALNRYLMDQAHYEEALAVHRAVARTRERVGGQDARVLRNLGQAMQRVGRLDEALVCHREALRIFQSIGDRTGEAATRNLLAIEMWQLGDYRASIAEFHRALALYRASADRLRESWMLDNLGLSYLRLGWYAESVRHQRRSLAIARELGERSTEGYVLANLGAVHARMGRPDTAYDLLHRALAISQEFNDRSKGIDITIELGRLHRRLGAWRESLDQLDRARAAASRTNTHLELALAFVELGETLNALGRPVVAMRYYRDAYGLARVVDRFEATRALAGIGAALWLGGRVNPARRFWRHALRRFVRMGVPEARQVRARLAAFPTTGRRRGPRRRWVVVVRRRREAVGPACRPTAVSVVSPVRDQPANP